MAEKRIVKLKSSDGEIFEVDEVVASQSPLIRSMIEDVGIDHPVRLLNASSTILLKVIDRCKDYVENEKNYDDQPEEDEMNIWPDAELVKVNLDTFYDLTMITNYMHIKNLFDVTCQTMEKMISKKTSDKILLIFNIKNEFPNEEKEEKIERKNQLLVARIETLPNELQHEIKVKVGQRFHNGMWSAWQYNKDTKTLIVELASLYNASDMDQQIRIILLHVDIDCKYSCIANMLHQGPFSSSKWRERVEWIEQMDLDLFKNLIDCIDMHKVEKIVVDDETMN